MKGQQDIMPPKIPITYLRWFFSPDLLEDVEGDLSELFFQRSEQSISWAKFKYFRDVLLLFRPGIIKNLGLKTGLINTVSFKSFQAARANPVHTLRDE